MIVLDTNVVSELMKAAPEPRVVHWADRQASTTLYLTSLTLAEIRFGIARLPDGRRRDALGDVFEHRIRPQFGDRVLAFDEAASVHYAALRSRARGEGLAISGPDALIAAIARAHGFAVATRYVAPFATARVPAIDPWATEQPSISRAITPAIR